MHVGEKHRADSDPRSGGVREHDLHPGLWDRIFGGDRNWRQTAAQQLFRDDSHERGVGTERQQLFQAEHVHDETGVPNFRYHQRPNHAVQWARRHWRIIAVARRFARPCAYCLFLLLLACGLSCVRKNDPQAAFDHANDALLHGDLKQAQDESHRGCQHFRDSPLWAWKFRTLEAKAVFQQGSYEDSLKILKSATLPSELPDLAVPVLKLEGEAYLEMHDFPDAERFLGQALDLCATSTSLNCGYALQARGNLAGELGQWAEAEQLFERSLAMARANRNASLEAYALVNLGNASLELQRFDEAIDRSEAGYQTAKALGARRLEAISRGNVGWGYYKLGDLEKALQVVTESEKLASTIGDTWDEENALRNIGYIYMESRKFDLAERSFQQALGLAQQIKAKEDIYNALRVLARLSLQTGDLEKAGKYAQQALDIARQDHNHADELYPMLVLGQIAARRGDAREAESTFHAVEGDKDSIVFLKWEAEHSLARLYEDRNRADLAEREYGTAVATFEAARNDVKREDFQLSFLTNAWHLYDDYVHFLVSREKAARGKTDDALRWADYSRARTLAEGLGLLAKGNSTGPLPLNARQIARRANGIIFFYWLGEAQSYLWAITPQKTSLFTLPPGAEIDAAVERYRKALAGPQDVLESLDKADKDGVWLYRTLIAPAHGLLKQDAKVLVIPDGSLNKLNFETLVAAEPTPHYWIEDADVMTASSLRVLGASSKSKTEPAHKLLLFGDSIAPSKDYPELPRAADQMASVARHFVAAQVYKRDAATPAAYLNSNPEQFSHIHFVAHGTASRLSPLDSAIVLSKSAADSDSFKLYARDIIRHPLQAELVTISACYSAGERSYSGEGLVGLAWAFLRAGAHNVIAASWEAADTSTDKLMDEFYEELNRGASPDLALRKAKLSMLRSESAFRKPFYWAPFQLYAGS